MSRLRVGLAGRWLVMVLGLLGSSSIYAGSISVAWSPAAGASGYRIYYGEASGSYSRSLDVGNVTEAVLSSLEDCRTWYLAIKAYNGAGESAEFSNELSGWSRPAVTTSSPAARIQGSQFTLDVRGQSFQPGATVEIDNPNVILQQATVISCDHIQLAVVVEPTAEGVRAAEVGQFTLTVTNPDDTYGVRVQGFEVQINPARFDVNRSDETTIGRLDGKDTVWMARLFGSREQEPLYDPDFDLDGNGWVDGEDLAYLASNLGRCWSGTGWTVAACPASL